MKTKLKFLKLFWDRTVVPAAGNTLGKIFYTSKNSTGARKQHVFNLDTNVSKYQTINASPADVTIEPGAVLIKTSIVPTSDKKLYDVDNTGTTNDVAPTITMTAQSVFEQHIPKNGSIASTNVLTGVLRNGVAALTSNVTITELSSRGLILNTTTGVVTLDSGRIGNSFTLTYKIEDKIDHTAFVEGTVIVEEIDLTLVTEPMTLTSFAVAAVGSFVNFNILNNIKRNGLDVSINDVTLVQNSATASGLILNTLTGQITINPAATAGNKVLQYTATDILSGETITGNIAVTITA
jgi:hypothetical protein